MRSVVALGACLLLSGCLASVGRDFQAPDPALPDAYVTPVPQIAGGARPGAWWQGYDDARLDALVADALGRNQELAAAEARLAEARALVGVAEAAGGPFLDASTATDAAYQTTSDGGGTTEGAAEGGLLFSWIPDLWGGQERQVEAARAEARARALLRDDLARQVVAEVVSRHLEVVRDLTRLELIDASLDLQRQTLGLVRERFAAGLASQLDVSRAEAQVASTQALRGPLLRDLASARAALAVLTGRTPAAVEPEAPPPIPSYDGTPVIGLPSDLLRTRPDVQAAEAALASAVAEIGVAEADFYPTLTIPGSLTVGAAGLGTGSVVEALVASIAASLDIPLFDSGAREARLAAAEARAREALLVYRQTLLEAVAQVEAALGQLQAARLRRENLQAAVAASEAAVVQARELYTQGLTGFLDVLDAERTLLDNRQDLAQARADVTLLIAELYSALGAPVAPAVEPGL